MHSRWPLVGASLISILLLVLIAKGHIAYWYEGHNGDHFYYAAMALQFAGHGYEQSLNDAASYFNYPFPAHSLNLGFLNPQVAPLIYPRTALPLLAAPLIGSMGLSAMYVPGFICGAAAVVTLTLFCWRRFGAVAGALVLPLCVLSRTVMEFGFGIYTESQVFLILSLLLWVLPWDGVPRDWRHSLTAMLLVAMLVFARQVTVVPAAMVAGGMLFGTVRGRSLRNEWLPFFAAVIAAAALSTIVSGKWAPFDPFAAQLVLLKVNSVGEVVSLLPGRLWHSLTVDTGLAWQTDTVTLLIVVLALTGAWLLRKTALPYVTATALVAGLLTTSLNGMPNSFRYLFPVAPMLIVLTSVALAYLSRRIAHRFKPDEQRQPATSHKLENNQGATVGLVAAAVSWSLLLAATIAVSQSAPLSDAQSLKISRAAFPTSWPLTDDSGTLYCSGDDYEVWFRNSQGTLYAFSGTAMAKSFLTPRLVSRSSGPVTYEWHEAATLLADGKRLCHTT